MGVLSGAIAAIKNGSRWELTDDKVRAAKTIDQDIIFVSDIEALLAELTDRYPQEPDAVFVQKMNPNWNGVGVSEHPTVKPTIHVSRAIELCQKYGRINLDPNQKSLPKRWEEKGLCRCHIYSNDVVYDPVKVQKKHKHAKANARRAERDGRLPYEIYSSIWYALGRKVTAEYGFIARIWGPSHYTFIYQHLPGFVKCLSTVTDRFRFKPYMDFLKQARPYRHGILKAELPKKEKEARATKAARTYRHGILMAEIPKIKAWQEFGKWLTAEIHAYCVYLRTKKAKKGKEGK